ncbi:hypothetical protein VKT23_019431 [Stygiomarasmius scandens]|uniref:F-box domain-containing protein n=1 Tax=Marasmiellus scandens TaxID=2682957 RepID=A0ABR1ILL2_9AGAR
MSDSTLVQNPDLTRRLSVELWKDVFEQVSSGGNTFGLDCFDTTAGTQLASLQPAFTLSMVCSWWRDIALFTPRIWSSISIYCSSDLTELDKIIAAKERSGTHPLIVAFYGRFDQFYDVEALVCLIDTAERWAHLRIHPSPELTIGTRGHQRICKTLSSISSLPILRSISTTDKFSSRVLVFPSFKEAPLLSSVTLHDSLIPDNSLGSLPLDRIQHLRLVMKAYTCGGRLVFVELLQRCRSLQRLELHDTYPRQLWGHVNMIATLQHLVSLSITQGEQYLINVLGVLSSDIRLPSLRTLQINVHEGSYPEIIGRESNLCEVFVDFVTTSCLPSQLTTLHLDFPQVSSDTLIVVLKSVPLLENLKIILQKGTCSDNLLLAMTADRLGQVRPELVPNLLHLHLGIAHFGKGQTISFSLLFSMLYSRRTSLNLVTDLGVSGLVSSKVVARINSKDSSNLTPESILGNSQMALQILHEQLGRFELVFRYLPVDVDGEGDVFVL